MPPSSHFVGMIKGKHALSRGHPSGPGMNWGFYERQYFLRMCALIHTGIINEIFSLNSIVDMMTMTAVANNIYVGSAVRRVKPGLLFYV